jgi:SAM-dependent methyltransferase
MNNTTISNTSLWDNTLAMGQINKYCMHLLCLYLDSSIKQKTSQEELYRNLSVAPNFKSIINLIINTLLQKGILSKDSNHLKRSNLFDEHLQYQLDHNGDVFKKYKGIYILLERCFEKYPRIISGSESALRIFFPQGSSTEITNLLQKLSAPYSNDINFPAIISSFIEQNNIKSILELGAGTGKLTWPLLQQLKTPLDSYIFTDISRSFLLDAEDLSIEYNMDFMKFKKADLNQPIPTNTKQKYDAIIAYNSIHIAKDLDITFQYLNQALSPDGYIILAELYQPCLWQHLTWGLLEGWWSFEDDYRSETPTLTPSQWHKILIKNNFQIISSTPAEQSIKNNDSTLIIAQKKH